MRVPEENQETNIILVHYKDYWTKKLLVLKDAEKDVEKWQTNLNEHEKKYDAVVPTQPMEDDVMDKSSLDEFDDELESDGDGDDGDECGSNGGGVEATAASNGNEEGEQGDDMGYNITDAVDPKYIHQLADDCSNNLLV